MVQTEHSRRNRMAVIDLTILVLVLLTIIVLIYQLRSDDQSNPAAKQSGSTTGPATFTDAQEQFKFNIPAEWRAQRQGGEIQVQAVAGDLPGYTMSVHSIEDLFLVVNWSCATLGDSLTQTADALAVWPAHVMYTDVPCAENPGQAAFARIYYMLDDGSRQLAIAALAPLDGLHWVVARSDPFTGDWPMALIGAMTESVTSSRR